MRILLPTDFSLNARNAIDYAVKIFEDNKVDFFLWHVVKTSEFISDDLIAVNSSSSVYESVILKSKESLEGLKQDLEIEYDNAKHTFHTLVDFDNFIDSVNQVIKLNEIDLIVMGTKGSSNLEKIIFGSNTIRVIQRSQCPVLVGPRGEVFRPIKKIAFSSNYKTKYNAEEFSILKKIIELQQSELEIIHVFNEDELTSSQEENKTVLKNIFKDYQIEFIELDGSDIYSTIHNYLSGSMIRLLCLTNKKHTFLERLFTVTNVEIEVNNISMPLLIIDC